MLLNSTHGKIIGTLWLIIISILFFLPGSAIPKNDWFSKIYFDKWVHIGFFAALVWLWCLALEIRGGKRLVVLLFAAVAYGLLVEIVQDQYIANRSFDGGDLLADAGGAIAGGLFWLRTCIKKINPCRNRGRNQN
jgi:hypothetical protein